MKFVKFKTNVGPEAAIRLDLISSVEELENGAKCKINYNIGVGGDSTDLVINERFDTVVDRLNLLR